MGRDVHTGLFAVASSPLPLFCPFPTLLRVPATLFTRLQVVGEIVAGIVLVRVGPYLVSIVFADCFCRVGVLIQQCSLEQQRNLEGDPGGEPRIVKETRWGVGEPEGGVDPNPEHMPLFTLLLYHCHSSAVRIAAGTLRSGPHPTIHRDLLPKVVPDSVFGGCSSEIFFLLFFFLCWLCFAVEYSPVFWQPHMAYARCRSSPMWA